MNKAAPTTFFEALAIGQSAATSHNVTEADIQGFAKVSGDYNPVHMDETYAKTTLFKGRIAHGLLSASFISAVFGMKFPGPGSIYVSQNLKFKAPVRIGDLVVTTCEITALNPEKKFVTFRTTCMVKDKMVIDGEAVLMVPTKN